MSESINHSDPLSGEGPKKRTRVQFSCTACRYRKLKCDRVYPCTNCNKRGDGPGCTFVGRGPRGKSQRGQTSPTLVQDRLQHLENLVMSLAQKQKHEQSPNQISDFNAVQQAADVNGPDYQTPKSVTSHGAHPSRDTGTLVVNDEGTSYFESADWRAILNEINGVKDSIDYYVDEETDDVKAEEYRDNDSSSPNLLLGMSRPVTKEELLIDIPSREITDRLISRFLKTTEPSLILVHIPTFRKEYELFWKSPQETSFTWLAYIYAILTLSVSHYHRSEEILPLDMVDSSTAWGTFRKRSAQALVQANYLAPGKYKAEALFFYSLSEFYRNQDAQFGVSYLFGILIRLAMRMGYHRDPGHYPSISAFDGEMRRRLWALMCQLDILISYQVGLPRTIQPWQFDTKLPSNLHDTDFDENTVQLPPPRPLTERTACGYTIGKSRIMICFGQITDLAYSREQVSYEEILNIDQRLEEAHDLLPPFLKYQPINQCLAEPTELIMRRYTLELLYQKARVVMHRRYMAKVDSKYTYSRNACLYAARRTLQHHSDVYQESLPGGQLYAERFFMNSFQNTDFMLSAMVLCLELSKETKRDITRMSPQERDDLLQLLETTYKIFKEGRHRSSDTHRGYVALRIMLSRVRGSPPSDSSTSDEQNMQENGQFKFQPEPHSIDPSQYQMDTSSNGDMQNTAYVSGEAPSLSSLGFIEDMLSTPDQMDWRLYDSRISGFGPSDQEILWAPDVSGMPLFDDSIPYPADV
ncbi:hypothetical protein PENSTE_c010G04977 [Penicillium steckii]|uniref:Zn(2)-C6 fungal-type domain-containing protein n=1 Tax=Penicillium steckii TaxID=303698 RepID=A0A1V6T8U4_9EURO|nr:hypothetical protein PENSTE_c010G04977 [Penicillium steckii]